MANKLEILQFCHFLHKLKHLKRTGWIKKGVKDPEAVASHMYRMAVLAMLVKEPGIDTNKCIKMALVHDLSEAVVGDFTPSCGISEEKKHKLEADGLAQITKTIPKEVADEISSLWKEFETTSSQEAKFVKDLDKFDMIVQAFEYETDANQDSTSTAGDGNKTKAKLDLQEFFDSTKDVFKTDLVKSWVLELNKQRGKE